MPLKINKPDEPRRNGGNPERTAAVDRVRDGLVGAVLVALAAPKGAKLMGAVAAFMTPQVLPSARLAGQTAEGWARGVVSDIKTACEEWRNDT